MTGKILEELKLIFHPDNTNTTGLYKLMFSLTHKNASDFHSFRTGLQVINKGQSAFLSANYLQGRLQTPQLVTVPTV